MACFPTQEVKLFYILARHSRMGQISIATLTLCHYCACHLAAPTASKSRSKGRQEGSQDF